MFEKVNPKHPDKIADRIAGALVDYAYSLQERPKIAVEVLIGHNNCYIIAETSVNIPIDFINDTVVRISEVPSIKVSYIQVGQDVHLAKNQEKVIKCGDNGIFKGMPVTNEQQILTKIAHDIYTKYAFDGKYIINHEPLTSTLIICQSNANTKDLKKEFPTAIVNPLGDWTGGINVDSGATNRKLGSDMGDSITGGGLHGKDLSKADVSVNICCYLLAQEYKKPVSAFCAIGDKTINFHIENTTNISKPYKEVVKEAEEYIKNLGGFEKFAEWGLIK